jgi:hypothetical protein
MALLGSYNFSLKRVTQLFYFLQPAAFQNAQTRINLPDTS